MFKIIWVILFIVFAVYTGFVYTNCDTGSNNEPGTEVIAGWYTWQEYNCQSCHQIYGLGGYMGPDLTNTAKDKGSEYMRTFIKYGTGKMPDFHLSDKEVNDLIAFLSWVDKSGQSIVPPESVHWTGSYTIKQQ